MKKALLISCFDWYENRLKYVEEYLKAHGFSVRYVTSDFDHIRKGYIDTNVKKNVEYIHVKEYRRNLSLQRCISHIGFSSKVKKIINEYSPDLIWCLVPPNSLAYVISRQKKYKRFKLIYDVIDLWPESLPYGKSNILPFRIWGNLRNKYLDFADAISVECELYRETISKFTNPEKIKSFSLVRDDIPKFEDEPQPFSQQVCVCYLGSINSLVDISSIGKLVSEISQRHTVLVRIIGDGDHRDELICTLKNSGAEVAYCGMAFDDLQKWKLMSNCHFGLNVYKNNVKIGLTMKSIEYFRLGLPIINSIPGDTEKLVEREKIGINCCDFSMNAFDEMLKNIDGIKTNARSLFLNEFCEDSALKKIETVLQ